MRGRLRAVLAAMAIGAAWVPFLAETPLSAAEAVRDRSALGVGVGAHLMDLSYDNPTRIAILDRLAAARVGWVRVGLDWRALEPVGPGKRAKPELDRLEFVVNAARERGIKVLVILAGTPPWANGGKDWFFPPADKAQYGRIAGWLAGYFKGRVAAWEIWNEPSNEQFWSGTVADYVAMVKAAYPAVKVADPDATVVVGSTIYNDDTFLRHAYDAGIGGSFDAISTHPYAGPSNAAPELGDTGAIWRMDHVRAVRKLMVEKGDEAKPIWFTEVGWSVHDNPPGAQPWELGVTEAVQADYLRRAFDRILVAYPYVSHVFWYSDRDTTVGKIHDDGFGLLRRDLSPRPAYEALKTWLDPATVVSTTTTTAPPLLQLGTEGRSSGSGAGRRWLLLIAPLALAVACGRRNRFGSHRWKRRLR